MVIHRVWPCIPVGPAFQRQAQLSRQGLHHDGRYLREGRQESPQKPHRAELHGAPKPGMREAVIGQKPDILRTEVEESGQLFRAGVGVVAPVAGGLLVAGNSTGIQSGFWITSGQKLTRSFREREEKKTILAS